MKTFVLNVSYEKNNPRNTRYPKKIRICTARDMKKAVEFDHVMATFTDESTRKKDHFICSDVLFADVDNSHSEEPLEWVSMDDIKRTFKDVQFYMVPSKSHMKEKDSKPAREKFHIYFPIAEVTNVDQHSGLLRKLIESFDHLHFDTQCKDSSRHFGATHNFKYAVRNDPPNSVLITDKLSEIEPIVEVKPKTPGKVNRRSVKGNIIAGIKVAKSTLDIFSEKEGLSDGRKDAMYRLACSCKATGLEYRECLSVVGALNNTFKPSHSQSEVQKAVENAEKATNIAHGTKKDLKGGQKKRIIGTKMVNGNFPDRLKLAYDVDAFSNFMLKCDKYEVKAIGFSGKGVSISSMQSFVFWAYDRVLNQLEEEIHEVYQKWLKNPERLDVSKKIMQCIDSIDNNEVKKLNLEETLKGKDELDSLVTKALENQIDSISYSIKKQKKKIDDLQKLTGEKPQKNLKSYLKSKGKTRISQPLLIAVASLIEDLHDSMWVEKLRRKIVVDGDYEKERQRFKESLNLSEQESKVIGKWVQNVKRRVLGKGNSREYIILFTSPEQGTGKSLFTTKLTEPISFATQEVSSDQFKDKGLEASLATTAVMIVNELKIGYQSGGDLEMLKRLVTMNKYSMRKVYATSNVEMTSICSFLASSNNEISDIVLDTENRRFYPIPWGRDRLRDILEREELGVYDYYQKINWIDFFNSVPLEEDKVWNEEDRVHFDQQSKKNVKANELEAFLLTHGEKILSECVREYGNGKWISATKFLEIYNDHRGTIGIKGIGYKVLKRDMTILNVPNKKIPPTNTSHYDVTKYVPDVVKAVHSLNEQTEDILHLGYQEVDS